MNVKLSDQTEFYLKTPQEMSRHEILELEKELKGIDGDLDSLQEKDYIV